MYTTTATVLPDSTNFTLDIPDQSLYLDGFSTGSTLYVAGYASAVQNASSEVFDTNTGRILYNAINTSGSSASIVMP